MLMPLIQRTWAPVGCTPVLKHALRHTHKISGIGALTVSPHQRRSNLYVHLHEARSIDSELVVLFLRDLLRHLRGPVIVVWDNINQHRSREVRQYVARNRRLTVEFLPPYAPELNPIEGVWCNAKHHRLSNHGITTIHELLDTVSSELKAMRARPALMKSFLAGSALPIDL